MIPPLSDINALAALINTGSVNPAVASLQNLKVATRAVPDFFPDLLPFICDSADRGTAFLSDSRVIDCPGDIELSQKDCLAILANAFLCRFTSRPSNNCRSRDGLPSINLDELHGDTSQQSVARAKLKMIFEYFRRQRERAGAGDSLQRPLRFSRRKAQAAASTDWLDCAAPLLPPVIEPLYRSLDDARDALRIDFANRTIGGAAIASYGCAQEEIMFCLYPELIAARLYFTTLRDDESILLRGAEQFSLAEDYGTDLGFGGRYIDPASLDKDGLLHSWILAVDALDFRAQDASRQYAPALVMRELNKLWAGLWPLDGPVTVATGHWGCGIFGGNPAFKFLIQWAAFSRAEKTMRYFPWGDEDFALTMADIISKTMRETPTVGLLVKRLFCPPNTLRDESSGSFGGLTKLCRRPSQS